MAQEKDFENKVKKFLKDNGCWFLKTWGNGMQRSGVPDILVCCKGGFIGIEVKADNGKPSDLQIYNLKEIDKSGGLSILLYPKDFEKFKALILEIKNHGFNFVCQMMYQEFKTDWMWHML